MLRPYREVLSHPGARGFSGAGVVARMPMSMVGIGIVLAISELYGSYGLAGQVSAVYVIAHAVCSPQLSRLVDRAGQARVMRPAVVVAGVSLTSLSVAAQLRLPPWVLFLAAVLTGASIGSMGALVRARWSHLLDDGRQLHTAYSLESALDELVFVVGPVLATVLATSVAPTAGLWVPVVAAVGGGLLLLAQRSTEPPPNVREPGTPRPSVMLIPGMVVLAVVFVGMGAIFGATDVATVAFAEEAGNKAIAGAVLAVFALGSLVAGLLYGARHFVTPLWRRFAIGMVALAAGASLFVLVDDVVVLALVMLVTGAAIAPTLITGNGLVQDLVPRSQLTEGLTWVGTALGAGVAIGSSLAGQLIDQQGSSGGFLVVVGAAAASVVATLASLRTLRGGPRRGAVPPGAHTGTAPGDGQTTVAPKSEPSP